MNDQSDLFNFNGMFYQIDDGCCRLDFKGRTAIKTSSGYKVYDLKTKKLINVNSFCFDIGSEMFYVIPTAHVIPGDNIIHKGKPRCVIAVDDNEITAINYETATREQIIPERHIFMGNVYFYGKIVSLMGGMFNFNNGSENGFQQMLQFRIMSQMLNGGKNGGSIGDGFSKMLPFMMMGNMFGGNANNCNNNIFGNMFNGIFGGNQQQTEAVAETTKKNKKKKTPKVIVEEAEEDEEDGEEVK